MSSSIPYDLQIEDEAAEKIESYLNPRFSKGKERDLAIDAIESELLRLASNPVEFGKTHPKFPFPRFYFKCTIGDAEQLFGVVFCYGADERTIIILDFKVFNHRL